MGVNILRVHSPIDMLGLIGISKLDVKIKVLTMADLVSINGRVAMVFLFLD